MTFPTQKHLDYAGTGVDVGVEAKAARILYTGAKKTWKNRNGLLGEIIVPDDSFSGLRFIRVDQLPEGTVMFGGSDGVATKSELAERAGQWDTLGLDLAAMLADDAVIKGGEPALMKSVLAVNTLGRTDDRLKYIQQLVAGYIAGADEANVAIINGEIAQHNDRMGPPDKFMVDWSGDITWFAHESRLLTGREVTPNDVLIGLREEGPRCNGISLIRRALRELYGNNWETVSTPTGQRLIDAALRPSRIYTRAMVDITGGWDLNRPARAQLHAAAHITGGGIPEKLGRALRPSGFGAIIDNPFPPSELMLICQAAGITDKEAYNTWNMGQGMICVSPEPAGIIQVAQEHGIEAQIIGRITEQPGISIHSKGLEGVELFYQS